MLAHAVDVVLGRSIGHDLGLGLHVLEEFEDEPRGDMVALPAAVVGQNMPVLLEVGPDAALDERPDHQADAVGEAQGRNAVRRFKEDGIERWTAIMDGD